MGGDGGPGTLEQMGFQVRSEVSNENQREVEDSNNAVTSEQIQQHNFQRLSSLISFNTKKGNTMWYYDEELKQALRMLELEWRKDNDTTKQFTRLNTGPLQQRKTFNKNGLPFITDFVWNQKGEHYDEELKQALRMLDLEWSKDNGTMKQFNRLSTGPLQQRKCSTTMV